MSGISQLLRLNTRVGMLALAGRWLGPAHVARGYDRAAPTYNDAWQRHLRPVTDDLLGRLPSGLSETVIDLGCGTGYATGKLASMNPEATVVGVDVSPGMLAVARQNAPSSVVFHTEDMLAFMRNTASHSCAMVVSTWALGYSHPASLFAECGRVLRPGGTFAFIVNYFDTLAPVFRAYQQCLLRFPESVRLAAWPRFPRSWQTLERGLHRARLRVTWHADGNQPVSLPPGPALPWLRQTGILAGFDAMLDFSGETEAFFEDELEKQGRGLLHHYAAVIAAML